MTVSTLTVILIVAAVLILAVAGWLAYRMRRAKELKARFGPEYTRAINDYGSEARAQDALAARQRRVEKIHIRPLRREDHDQFLRRWEAVQSAFVDDPSESTRAADQLVNEVMQARGYPMVEFEFRAEDISVDHPQVVQDYRAAHGIAQRLDNGQASTEDLRQALVHYRTLFDSLLETQLITGGRKQ